MIRANEIDFNDLPAAPHLLVKLVDAFTSDEVSFEDLEATISLDGALTAKVLAVANSAAYRQWNDVLDLRRILVVLGTRPLKSLVLTTAVHQFFAGYGSTADGFSQRLWFEALEAAHCARRIAELLAYPQPNEAYLIGLMHGVGQLVLFAREEHLYAELLRASSSSAELMTLEQRHFGVTNPELAAQIFAHWHLDPVFQQAVFHQYASARSLVDMPLLVKVVNTAAHACFSLRHAPLDDSIDDQFFGLNQAVIDQLVDECRKTAREEARSFGVQSDADEAGDAQGGDALFLQREVARRELARRIQRIALVEGVQSELCPSDEREQLLPAIARQLTLIFGVGRTLFYLLDDSGSRLIPIGGDSGPGPTQRIDFVDGQNLISSSLAARQIRTLSRGGLGGHRSAFDRELLLALNSETMLVLPLLAGDALIGAAAVGWKGEAPEAGSPEVELLAHFASACGTALQQSRRRRRELQLNQELQQQSQELATRELLHEISSPLTIIGNYLELLRSRQTASGDAGDEIGLIKEEIQRVSTLITQFRNRGVLPIEEDSLNLNDLVRQVVELLVPSVFKPRHIDVELSLDEEMPLLQSESGSLRQILTNLLVNAGEALDGTGRVRVVTRSMIVVDQTRYSELVVSDNGPGVPPELVPGLFSPVSSSKGGRHEGLGLTIVYQLVKRLNGQIRYRRVDGGGAEFAVLIPMGPSS
ncbi:MAG: HDOD domain-containing protein [Halieaceae bacterium]|jgi:signal transduction histidine kinase/HD-like signal output (HDOD) protein|nr:HDOD domain-containing protein [Halieaceae bacterium]